jgi:hypothetical protein
MSLGVAVNRHPAIAEAIGKRWNESVVRREAFEIATAGLENACLSVGFASEGSKRYEQIAADSVRGALTGEASPAVVRWFAKRGLTA